MPHPSLLLVALAGLGSASATVANWIPETEKTRSLAQGRAASAASGLLMSLMTSIVVSVSGVTAVLELASATVANWILETEKTRSSALVMAVKEALLPLALAIAVLESASRSLKMALLLQGQTGT
ncbi:hypothetical protein FBB35_14325 [Nostoc sp. TCL240-02]|nr:hypothetical protein FBB35_14325 [Nostoc sp. TCL240-02]